jgi:hypothetical protein
MLATVSPAGALRSRRPAGSASSSRLLHGAEAHALAARARADLFIDETLQTLQYASRVKTIKNRPNVAEADELRYLRAALMELHAVRKAVRASEPADAPARPDGRPFSPCAASTVGEDEYLRALAVADQERLVSSGLPARFPVLRALIESARGRMCCFPGDSEDLAAVRQGRTGGGGERQADGAQAFDPAEDEAGGHPEPCAGEVRRGPRYGAARGSDAFPRLESTSAAPIFTARLICAGLPEPASDGAQAHNFEAGV